jgi:hypothetical protein
LSPPTEDSLPAAGTDLVRAHSVSSDLSERSVSRLWEGWSRPRAGVAGSDKPAGVRRQTPVPTFGSLRLTLPQPLRDLQGSVLGKILTVLTAPLLT